ncbi:MAG: branched-chain amino acid ABC transporter permease [Acetobacteraceae bacterium]
MLQTLRLFAGPHDIGGSRWFWAGLAIVVLGFFCYPVFGSEFSATNISFYLLNIPLGLGLALLWGYGGVLSFGQVTFFTIAGYGYGVVAGNMTDSALGTIVASFAGLAAAGALSAVFGYFVFFSRVAAWIVPILTLVLTLLVSTFLGLTAGYQWRIGDVLLGGYNGMTNIPQLHVGSLVFQGYSFYYLAVAVVIICYVGLRIFVNSHSGQAVIAMREDDLRMELLGYDVRLQQLGIFVFAALLSGVSGLLYVQWGNYITPSSASLISATLPVIWVAVGGRDSLLAVCIATFLLNQLTYVLSSQGNRYAFIIVGAILVGVMLFTPQGIVVTVARHRIWHRRTRPRDEPLHG